MHVLEVNIGIKKEIEAKRKKRSRARTSMLAGNVTSNLDRVRSERRARNAHGRER